MRRSLRKTAALTAALLLFAHLAVQAGETRTVEHLAGQTQVPVQPKRVVVLWDHLLLLPLLELGYQPVAAAGRYTWSGEPHFRGTENYDTDGIKFLGFFNEPDLEALVASEPDLIIGASLHNYLYELLSEIGPTVLLPTYESGVRDTSQRLAKLVNRQERYGQMETDYLARLAEVRSRIGEPSDYTAMHLQLGNGLFTVHKLNPIDEVLTDLGFQRPPIWDQIGPGYQASIEALHQFDADILIDTYEPLYNTREATRRYRESAFWQSLFAVENDQFLFGERSEWMAMSFASLHRVLDAIETLFQEKTVLRQMDNTEGGR